MPSGLRAKLNAMKTGPSAPPKQPAKTGGLMCRVHRLPLEDGLFDLSPTGLRRMGWSGRIFDIRKCLFLDTETTGLSKGAGTIAFLVGIGYVDGNDFVVEQFQMRDYPDEPELISRLSERMARFDCLCTFNGKNFDMPLLESRFTMCRMRHLWKDMENVDLLYPARRAWKLRLGSCRLARLEEMILGMPRDSDLPGSEVPQRFFDYLKTGDESLLTDILDHNRQDIATLATLLVKLCAINDAPESLTDRRDLFSMGKALERQGEFKPARELYRISAIPAPAGTLSALTGERISGLANQRLCMLHRKAGDYESMRAVLEQMLIRRQMPGWALIELSKLFEHRFKDFAKALEYARKAGQYPDCETPEALEKRIARLKYKVEHQTDI